MSAPAPPHAAPPHAAASDAVPRPVAAFAAQVAVLCRRGLPLGGRGDVGIGADLARRVAGRLGRGDTLDVAFAPERGADAAVLRAALTAAERSGRPAEVLAELGRDVRARRSLRRDLTVASVYPLLVVLAAAALGVLLLPRVAADVSRMIAETPDAAEARTVRLDLTTLLAAAAAGALLLAGGWWWLVRGRGAALVGGAADRRRSRFATHLALQLERGVPLDDAVPPAAAAAGDRALGGASGVGGADFAAWPPLLRWAVRSPNPPAALRQAAIIHQRRAARSAGRTRLIVPLLVTLVVGGGAVLAYGLAVVLPIRDLFTTLTEPR